MQFSRVVLLLGGFHVGMVFLTILGQRFGDAGLQDILVDSGLTGPNVVTAVLGRKQYN